MDFTSKIEGEVLWIHYKNPLRAVTADSPIFKIVNDALQKGLIHCVIDTEQAKFLGSVDLGVMINILTKFRNKGGEVLLMKPSEQIQRILITTKLSSVFTIVNTQKEAKNIFDNL